MMKAPTLMTCIMTDVYKINEQKNQQPRNELWFSFALLFPLASGTSVSHLDLLVWSRLAITALDFLGAGIMIANKSADCAP